MLANLEHTIMEMLHVLPKGKQLEVLGLVKALLDKEQSVPMNASTRTIGEIFDELNSQIPFDEWAQLPSDGAEQHDHYLYGSPKQSSTLNLPVAEIFADTFYWICPRQTRR